MTPPCLDCEHRNLSKSAIFIWHTRPPDEKTRKKYTYRHNPKYNRPNPCYDCKKPEEYDDFINGQSLYAPTYIDYVPAPMPPEVEQWETESLT